MSDITSEVAKENPKEGFSGDEYNHVARNSELETIKLLSSKFNVAPEGSDGNGKLKLSYGRKIVACQYIPEDSAVVAIFQYHVDGKRSRKKVFGLVAEYGVSYTLPNDSTEAAALGFCRNIGQFAAYPYFRGLAAHVFAEAGLRVPPLPAIASTAHIQKKVSAEAN